VTESTDATEPTEPIDKIEPLEPMLVLREHGGADVAIGLAVDDRSFATAYAGLRRGGPLEHVPLLVVVGDQGDPSSGGRRRVVGHADPLGRSYPGSLLVSLAKNHASND